VISFGDKNNLSSDMVNATRAASPEAYEHAASRGPTWAATMSATDLSEIGATSALPPKADIGVRNWDVRFVQIAHSGLATEVFALCVRVIPF
jgi:hypothetical protein